MDGILILHFTDLHLKERIEYLEQKISSIKEIINNFSYENLLILFTGDIANYGYESEYKHAQDFIEKLKKAANRKISVRLAICPGNHDRDFKNYGIDAIDENIIKSINSENYINYVKKYKQISNSFVSFLNEVSAPTSNINDSLNYYKFKFTSNDSSYRVAIYSLDNALLSHFEKNVESDSFNYGKIFIPKDFLNIDRNNEDYCLLISHFPTQYFRHDIQTFFKEVLKKKIDIIFDGHTHNGEIVLNNTGFIEITGSPLYANGLSGFSLIELVDKRIVTHQFIFDENKKKYCENNSKNSKFTLEYKTHTCAGLKINNDIFEYNEIILPNGVHINSRDLFVFPLLTENMYSLSRNDKQIKSTNDFLKLLKKNRRINIKGYESSGKTILSYHIFSSLVKADYNPLLTDGSSFGDANKNKQADKIIKRIIDNNYDNVSLAEYLSLDKKVLIIDNANYVKIELLDDLQKIFDCLILLSDDEITTFLDSESELKSNGKIVNLKIEPFYKEKRQKLLEKVYVKSCEIKSEIECNFSKEDFVNNIENIISKLDKYSTIDPENIIYLATNYLFSLENHDRVNIGLQSYKINQSLNTITQYKGYSEIKSNVSTRILGYVAYDMYKNNSNFISKSDIERITNDNETDIYGNVINNYDFYLKHLCDLHIMKIKNGNYTFYNRRLFAYFISEHIVNRMHRYNSDLEIKEVITRDIYSPLNMDILLNIAGNYKYTQILTNIIEDMWVNLDLSSAPTYTLNSLTKYFDSSKERIMNISKEERDRINKISSAKELSENKKYIEHADDYYYVRSLNKESRKLMKLISLNQVVSILLGTSFSDIEKTYKDKLINISIALPNLIIKGYLEFIDKSLDELYSSIEIDVKSNGKYTKKQVDQFFELLISYINSFILTIFDIGSRPFQNESLNKRVIDILNNFKMEKDVKNVQRFMILSFSSNKKYFIKEVEKYLQSTKDINSLTKNYIRLIARRFCLENYDYLIKENNNLLSLVSGGKKNKVLGDILRAKANKKLN